MSYIHEALKKAQKERNSIYHEYHGVVSTPGTKSRYFSGKIVWGGIFAVILLAFTAYLLLSLNVVQNSLETPASKESTGQAKGSENIVSLYESAALMHKQGHLKEARQLYEKVLKIDPNNVNALNNLGVVYISEANYSLAETSFSKAIELEPEYVDSHYNLACIYALNGEPTKSLVHLEKAVALDKAVKVWARQDTDLKRIRGLPEFKKIIESS